MNCFDRRTGLCLLFLAITTASPSSATAGKFPKPGGMPTPVDLPRENAPPDPPPTPPEAKGWPHSILTGSATQCARDPGPNEVIVYRDGNFTGNCAVLVPGFYPFAANLLIGDDTITSIKVGSGVRARAFKDAVYSGNWNAYPAGTRSGGLGGFNDTITSMRVEPASRSQTCDDLRDGEIALYRNRYLQGDCVVLPGDESYANAEVMGIANDSISSIHNNSARRLQIFWHANFTQSAQTVEPYRRVNGLSLDGWATDGIDDDTSSVQMLQ